MKDDARMIMNAHTMTEVNGQLLPKAHRPSDMFADLSENLAAQPEVAARLAAAERRALGEEMERRPDLESLGRTPMWLDDIDAEPQARPRQPAHVGNRLLDQPFELVLRSLMEHRSKSANELERFTVGWRTPGETWRPPRHGPSAGDVSDPVRTRSGAELQQAPFRCRSRLCRRSVGSVRNRSGAESPTQDHGLRCRSRLCRRSVGPVSVSVRRMGTTF